MRKRVLRAFVLSLLLLILALLANGCRGLQAGGDTGGGGNGGGGGNLGTTQSKVKRVVVVVMQNRSFDHLFGKYTPTGGQTIDGIRPGVPGYTQSDGTTPFELTDPTLSDLPHGRQDYLDAWNHGAMDRFAVVEGHNSMGYYTDATAGVGALWNLADNYALNDNYFSSVMSNAPSNQLYLVAASDNDFPFSVQPAFGPCNLPDPASQPYNYRNLGDQLRDANISWGWFQANYGDCGNGYVPVQNPFQYFTSTHDAPQLQNISNFFSQLNSGNLPAISFVQANDRNSGHPGSGPIGDSLNWLNDFVSQVKASPAWDSIAIVVIWDEGGGYWDHVPPPQVDSQGLGIRVPLLVISPFAKAGYVSHVRMNHVSVLKFIQWNWSLPSLNARNSEGNDLRDMFQF